MSSRNNPQHRQQGVVAFLRQATGSGEAAQFALVLLNFSDADAQVSVQFPAPGRWIEQIDAGEANARPDINVSQAGQTLVVRVPSNYGGVYTA